MLPSIPADMNLAIHQPDQQKAAKKTNIFEYKKNTFAL